MKRFSKGLVAGISAITLLSSGLGTIGTGAQDAVLQPSISGEWQGGTRAGEPMGWNPSPNTASLNVDYGNAAYSGKRSITAFYDAGGKLITAANGTVGADGAVSYTVSVPTKDAARVKSYVWDMQTMKPEAAADEMTFAGFNEGMSYKVPSFSKGTGYRVRSSFETDVFGYFIKESGNKANMEITDEVPANTGTKCVKITDRNADYATLNMPIKTAEIGKTAKIVVSCYVRKPENVEKAQFYVQAVVPKNGGGSYYPAKGYINNVTDNDWHKLTAEYDLTDTATFSSGIGDGTVQIRICAKDTVQNKDGDFYADDFSVVAANASRTVFYDDTNAQKLKWDFENGVEAVSTNRKLDMMADLNKWTMTIGSHTIKVENTSDALFCNPDSTWDSAKNEDLDAVKIPAEGSQKMLVVTNNNGMWKGGSHISSRVKISKLDLVPGKKYELSFWAYGNSVKRALYAGLLPQDDAQNNPLNFCGSHEWCGGTAAPGLIQYGLQDDPINNGKADYLANRAALMPRSWHKYTYSIIPKESDFNTSGFTDLYFVMTYDRGSGTKWEMNNLHAKEKLYIDEVEITEKPAVTAIDNTGVYTKRACFENDTMEMFANSESNGLTYTLVNSIPANTGDYCVAVTNRGSASDTLKVSLDGVDGSSKITASCYVRNYDYTTNKTWYNFRLVGTDADGKSKEIKGGKPVQVFDSSWHKLTAEFDLPASGIDLSTATVQLRTSTGNSDKANYYADDFTVISDKPGDGTFYDDFTVTGPEKDETMSATANSATFREGNDIEDITALYTKYQDKFKIGAAIANGAQKKSGIYAKLFKKHFNGAVSDGYFKMPEILQNPATGSTEFGYNFKGADEMMEFCLANGISDITAHALIYDTAAVSKKYFYNGDGSPTMSRDDALGFMEEYITRVMNHFNGNGDETEYTTSYKGGSIAVWDVVNEAVDDSDAHKIRENFFGKVTGGDYVTYAFQVARNLYPNAELRYNDYCSYSNSKAQAVSNLVKGVLDVDDTLIDRIGVQSHYHNDTDINTINRSLDILLATDNNLKIDITELDIRAYTHPEQIAQNAILENGVTKAREYRQAKLLKDLFTRYEAMAKAGRLDRVVFWTFADGYAFPNQEGDFWHKDYAGLFDRRFHAKPQYYILTDNETEFNARYPDYQSYINN